MNKNAREFQPVRGTLSFVTGLLYFCFFLATSFAVIGYAAGWIEFDHDDAVQEATIEIETGEMKADIEFAVASGREVIEETGETLEELAESDAANTQEYGGPEESGAIPTSDKAVD